MTSNNKQITSNWTKLKAKVCKPVVLDCSKTESDISTSKPTEHLSAKVKSNYLGLDCEMVGIGPDGTQSALARCCIVDFDGEVVYDEFVRPPGFVTDFRTKWSGIRKKDLRQGTAISLIECQTAVANLLKDKVLVGHALKNDLDVLMLSHPRRMIRDTACYRPYMRIHGKHGKVRPRALKDLTKEHLDMEIQTGEHDPGVDARCAMMLYRKARVAWEQQLKDLKYAAKLKATTEIARKQEQRSNTKSTAPERSGNGGSVDEAKKKHQSLVVLRSGGDDSSISENKKGKIGKILSSKDKSLSNCDVEIQVLGDNMGDCDDRGDRDDSGEDENGDCTEPLSVNSTEGELFTKKRKISGRSGKISSRSSKNFAEVDHKLNAAKRARTLATAQTEKGCVKSSGLGGMFAYDAIGGSASKSVAAKSIFEVDRALKASRRKK
mmetsp:Transcript_24317/g.48774  ORF Transcript_24317/g.48774 Transcript_24317/m.48774 type:complete len:436 (-) Transcript_24317:65-1372(-)